MTVADTQVILQAMFYLPAQVNSFESLAGTSDLSAIRAQLKSHYQTLPEWKERDPQNYVDGLDPVTLLMQHDYISRNPHAPDEHLKLNKGGSASPYHAIHASMQPVIHKFIKNFDFKDLYLLDLKSSRVLYSTQKHIDFGLSLEQGPLTGSGLAQAYQKGKTLKQHETAFIDFSSYLPAGREPVGFMATPVFYEGQALGLVVVQIGTQQLNAIMSDRSGMGESGDTYLVGSDYLMRTDSIKDSQHTVVHAFNHPEQGQARDPAVESALKGQTGVELIDSFDGTPVLSAFAPLNVKGIHWALIAELNQTEAFASASQLQQTAIFIFLGAMMAIILIAF